MLKLLGIISFCLVLHKVKVFIHYAQGLVQLLLLIFTSMISFSHCIFMKYGKAVNYNGSEIIGLINLKYGKRTACQDIFLPRMRYFPEKQGKGH